MPTWHDKSKVTILSGALTGLVGITLIGVSVANKPFQFYQFAFGVLFTSLAVVILTSRNAGKMADNAADVVVAFFNSL